MPYLTNLATIARRTGYPVVEVSGWRTRGHGPMATVQTITPHHTATSRRAAGDYPSLRIVRDGHGSLPGPLSHFGLGRNGTIYVIAAGLCYHTGATHLARQTNRHNIGIEAENDGVGEPWPARQMDSYAKLCAELAKAFNLPTARVQGHKEIARPAGRKIDPTFNMNSFRQRVGAARRGGSTAAAPAPRPSAPASSTSQYGPMGGGGTQMKYTWYEVTAPLVNIRTGPSTKHRVVRQARRGERVLVRGNDSAAWVLVGANLRMNRRAAKLKRVNGPRNNGKLTHGQWPDRLMPRVGRHTHESDKAWRDLLARQGFDGPRIVENMQRWLNSRGHKLKVDNKRGPLTTKALQRQVGAKVDGVRGQETINRELIFLNNQRRFLTPQPPRAIAKYRDYRG